MGIPVYLTRLIGRRRDLEALEQRLLEGRLITLVGPGGVGKTRLAVEAARRWNERFDDGVIFASLVDVSTGDEAAAVVAAEADVDSRPGSALIDGLIERFAGNQTLVVLDNLEHLAPHAAQLVNGLLAAEGITILGTSRAPLGIPGEIVLRVEPLPHPIAGAAVADALASPAIELLIDRLRASRPERTVSDDDLAELVMIAQAVEGLPLGLELAAARADVLDLQELRRLAGWSTLALGTSATSVAERHRSLRSAIEWSVRLLSEPARDLVMRCGLLAGGATLDLLAELSRRTSPETLSIVDELVRASLLQRTVGRSTRTRYRLLEPVRQFQAEELTDKGLGREVRQSILNHCVAIAHRVDALDGTAEGWTAADELGDDYWNAVASVRWALTNDEISDHVIDLLLTMYVPIIKGKRGFANELARLYVGLLDSGKASERHRLRLARRGTLLYLETGQHELAHELSDRGVELAVATGDDLALADAREVVGVVRLYQGHLDEAERHFNECEPIIQRSGPAWRRAQVRGGRAIMARHRGHLEEAVAIAQGPRDAGDANLHHVYQALDVSIAEALSAQGRWQEALSRTSEVTAWAERYDNRHLLEEATLAAFDAHLGAGELAEADDRLANLSLDTRHASLGVVIGYQTRRARLAALSGDLTAAWLAADEAVSHARALGWGEEVAQALATLGQVALASNDLEQAGHVLREAFKTANSAPFAATLANALDGLVIEAVRMADRPRALGLGAAVQWLRASTGCVRVATTYTDELRPIIEAVTPTNSWFEPGSAKLTVAGQDAVLAAATEAVTRRQRPSVGWESLTKSELAVARLVADGLRNRQIAEKLHISTRTVDSHVAHSFTKLDLTTRTQLAAEALRRPR